MELQGPYRPDLYLFLCRLWGWRMGNSKWNKGINAMMWRCNEAQAGAGRAASQWQGRSLSPQLLVFNSPDLKSNVILMVSFLESFNAILSWTFSAVCSIKKSNSVFPGLLWLQCKTWIKQIISEVTSALLWLFFRDCNLRL